MCVNLDVTFSLQSILIKLGFEPSNLSLQFDFGNCVLKAVASVNEYFQEGFNFFGNFSNERTSKMFAFFLPKEVASYEQGIALIAYYLRNTEFDFKPEWLSDGLALSNHLPWKTEQNKYKERPSAEIESEWFRVLVKKIRLLLPTSNEEDLTEFSFDGAILKIQCNNETFAITAKGKNWEQTATVQTKTLDFLPKRIQNGSITISIWEGRLSIGNRRFAMVSQSYD